MQYNEPVKAHLENLAKEHAVAIASDSNPGRLVPEPPPADQRVRLLIDSDAANEIDDLYAIALAVATPERFAIEGFVATHFAASAFGTDGPASTEKSYRLIGELLDVVDDETPSPAPTPDDVA